MNSIYYLFRLFCIVLYLLMSVKEFCALPVNKFLQVYSDEWTVSGYYTSNHVQTAKFFPFPDSDIRFHFEIFFNVIRPSGDYSDVTVFELSLVKSSFPQFKQQMFMDIDLTVRYSNNKIFKTYRSTSPVDVISFNSVVFVKDVSKMYNKDSWRHEVTEHGHLIANNLLILSCRLIFYYNLTTPQRYVNDMMSLKNHRIFAEELGSAFESEIMTDVEIEVNNETFRAHKFILAAHSSVFKNMLENRTTESNNTITITDSEVDIFKTFLTFLYSGTVNGMSIDVLRELCSLANEYEVKAFKIKAAEIVAPVMTKWNIFDILRLADYCDSDDMKRYAVNFSSRYFQQLMKMQDWIDFTVDYPRIALEIVAHANLIPVEQIHLGATLNVTESETIEYDEI